MPLFPTRHWAELGTRDFARAQRSGRIEDVIAVLPVAAIEQHGPHLPVSVDLTLLEGVLAATLARLDPELPVLVLPTQPVGKSNEHIDFPGTLTLEASTLIALWSDIGASVARAGVRRFVLFNGHGGQVSAMDIVARELRVRHRLLAWSVSWFSLPLGPAAEAFSAAEHRFGIHGGEIETSMMLALAPHTVDMAQARDFRSSSQDRAGRFPILGNGSAAKMGWQTQDYNPMGAVGNAAAASADKGRALIDAAGAAMAQLLGEMAQVPLSTLVDRPQIPD